MTPLLAACKNGFLDVALFLSKLPSSNLNHTDKVSKCFHPPVIYLKNK